MPAGAEPITAVRAAFVMNPRSGGGKVGKLGLIERAEAAGARVSVIGGGEDPAALARRAVEEGAEVLGVAGGDGTVSTVAAVAGEADRPLVVVPAGTRNHFARDVGVDIRHPVAALDAVHEGRPVRVDLGLVNERPFVNNVSLGLYAEALLTPHYRDRKALALASTAAPHASPSRPTLRARRRGPRRHRAQALGEHTSGAPPAPAPRPCRTRHRRLGG